MEAVGMNSLLNIREITLKRISLLPMMISLFFVSASMFVFQVTLIRVFSPMLRYHFVFMLTSMAIFGLGIGGIISYRLGKQYSKAQLASQLPGWLIVLASSYILSFSLIYKLPFMDQFVIYSTIAAFPYVAGGIFLSIVFMEMAEDSHKLYFADLLGAGIGSIMVVLLISKLGIVNTVLIVAGFAVLSSMILAVSLFNRKQIVIPICAVIILGLIGTFQPGVKQFERRFTGYFTSPFTSLYRLRTSNTDHKLEDWYWDAYSRTDVIDNNIIPGSKIVTIDGGSNSMMFQFDGDLNKVQNLKSDLNYLPFEMGKNDKILLIGSGGGKDILLSLLAGSKDIDVVEINEGSVRMARKYEEYNGRIYDREGVNVFIQDGRNFIKQTQEKYDHIYLAQVMTDATETVGYSLAENFIYTKEAVMDYWKALQDDGRLSFSLHDDRDMARLLFTILVALEEFGFSESQIRKHIVAVNQGVNSSSSESVHMPLVVIKKSPYTQEEMIKLIGLIKSNKHVPLYLPYEAENGFLRQFHQVSATKKLAHNQQRLNLTPTTDNRPYFFDFERGIHYTLLVLLGGILMIGLLLFKPIFKMNSLRRSPYYFIGLGIGFMLIEIPMIQKFTLLLGHPTRSFIVILIALLTGGGAGSLLGGWKKFSWKDRYLPLMMVPLFTAGVYLFSNGLMNRWVVSSLIVRVLISIGLLFPLGFFMGMPFPLGIRILKQVKNERAVPLMLGINGTMSIGGSVLAVIISMKFGLSYSLAMGGFIYLLLFLSMPLYEKDWKVS
jgi:tRNA1(Val) A37 N6-methylase TrmN6